MRDRRRFGERRRRSWLGSFIQHDPDMARLLFIFGCIVAYASYATGWLQLFLAELKADLVARLTPLAPLLIRAAGAVLGAGLVLALLIAARVIRFVPPASRAAAGSWSSASAGRATTPCGRMSVAPI
jgi:hypothetical protein